MSKLIYNSQEQVADDVALVTRSGPRRQIGVAVRDYPQGRREAEMTIPEIFTYTPYPRRIASDHWQAGAADVTREAIARIDAVIEELQRHRARLVGEAKKLEAGEA